MVLYRKYRPQTFADLFGQEQIKILVKNLQAGKLAHAYIFTGSRGSGKTSTARLLAKAINCLPSITFPQQDQKNLHDLKFLKNGDVCGDTCANCQAIRNHAFLDLIEIDAASNRGIDEIRDLREKARLSTSQGLFKVYIIDEVHMLTQEAFNALLKTLEEPPDHVVFVLATTEIHKIPATILSRAQKYEFQRASTEDIFQYLKKIAGSEKFEADDEALRLIARAADGSFRDGAKWLEQLSSGSITAENVQSAVGFQPVNVYQELLACVLNKELNECVGVLNGLNKGNINAKEFTNDLIRLIQNLMLVKSGLKKLVAKECSEEEITFLESLTATSGDLAKLSDLLLSSLKDLVVSPLPFLPMQVALVKFINPDQGIKTSVDTASKAASLPEEAKAVLASANPNIEDDLVEAVTIVKEEVKIQPPVEEIETKVAELKTKPDLNAAWYSALKAIRPKNVSLEALLRSSEPLDIDDDELTIRFFYAFHKQKVNETKNLSLLTEALTAAFGRRLKVKFVMGQRPTKPKGEIIQELKNVSPVTDDNLLNAATDIFTTDVN